MVRTAIRHLTEWHVFLYVIPTTLFTRCPRMSTTITHIMESFQFSALHEATAIAFSPGSTFVATATQNTILVRSAKTLQVVRQWDCDTNEASGLIVIDDIKWSGNGTRLLAASKHSDCAWVLDLSCEKAIARVEAPHVRTDWGLDDIRIWTEAVRPSFSFWADCKSLYPYTTWIWGPQDWCSRF